MDQKAGVEGQPFPVLATLCSVLALRNEDGVWPPRQRSFSKSHTGLAAAEEPGRSQAGNARPDDCEAFHLGYDR